MAPVWLMHPDGSSCGQLEDTRRPSASLPTTTRRCEPPISPRSRFKTSGPEWSCSGKHFAAPPRWRSRLCSSPLPPTRPRRSKRRSKKWNTVAAPATVYGVGLEPFPLWHLNTADLIMSENSRAPRVTARAGEILHKSNILHNPYLEACATARWHWIAFGERRSSFSSPSPFSRDRWRRWWDASPIRALRLDILHNLVEEHGEFQEQLFHHTTFQQFLRSIGGNPEQLQSTPLWPAVRAFNSVLTASCVLDELEVGVACMGIIEYAFAGISAAIGSAVVRNGWVTSENLVHYKLHAEIDERHAEEFFAVIEPHEDDPHRRHFIDQGLKLGALHLRSAVPRPVHRRSRGRHGMRARQDRGAPLDFGERGASAPRFSESGG